ncbi:MAG TPA: SgcJ/EcaC family oxidoreductase [Gemmatimonadales bacterium]
MTASFTSALVLSAVASVLTGCSHGAGSTMEPSARQAIQAAVGRYVRASNLGDVETLTSLYADDAVLLPPDHAPVEGRKAIEEFWRQGTDQGLKVTTLRLEVAGDVGYLIGQYNLPATAKEEADSGKYVMCLKRQRDGAWKLTADIWNSSSNDDDDSDEPSKLPSIS